MKKINNVISSGVPPTLFSKELGLRTYAVLLKHPKLKLIHLS